MFDASFEITLALLIQFIPSFNSLLAFEFYGDFAAVDHVRTNGPDIEEYFHAYFGEILPQLMRCAPHLVEMTLK